MISPETSVPVVTGSSEPQKPAPETGEGYTRDQLSADLKKAHALNGQDPEGTTTELLKTAGKGTN